MKLADRLFGATYAEAEIDSLLEPLLPSDCLYSIGWDYYDCSLEIHGVPPDWRLPKELVDRFLDNEGFKTVFVNHTDKWETHYTTASKEGWRVSYPYKRKDFSPDISNIWVEGEIPKAWPKDMANVVVFPTKATL